MAIVMSIARTVAIVTSFARTVAIVMSIADRAPAALTIDAAQRGHALAMGSTVARDARASIAIATAPIDARSIDDSRATYSSADVTPRKLVCDF